MGNLMLSLKIVFPICFVIGLGYFFRRTGVASKETMDQCGSMVFQLLIPFSLFMSLARTDPSQVFDGKLAALVVAGSVVWWGLCMAVYPKLEQDPRKIGVMVQASFRGNGVLFGIPIATSLAGPLAGAVTAIMVAINTTINNILAVVALERFRGRKADVRQILKGIVTNPLIITSALGVGWMLTGWELPALVADAFDMAGKMATPLALLALGGTLDFGSLKGNRRQISVVLVSKLILLPVLAVGAGVLVGLRGVAIACLLGLFATPPAVSSFPMAKRMGGDGELAAEVVVVCTVSALVTLFLWIFAVASFGLI